MFNRRLLIDSGGEQQTYSVLEIHVDTPDGDHVRSARVELTYNGESNLANTDNKGIAVFYGVPTGTEISYTITAAGHNAATGKWIIPTNVEYETEYVVLSPVIYNGGVTYCSLEMLEDTTVIDYFDRRNGQTVDVQLIDQ